MNGSQALGHLLAVPIGSLGPLSKPRRTQSILEARAWPSGPDVSRQRFVRVSPDMEGYSVHLGKPGKEAAPGYGRPNPHDMTPTVFEDGRPLDWTPTFDELFRQFQHMAATDDPSTRAPADVLELLACLLFRSAFMLDHVEQPSGSGRWRYAPPEPVVAHIEAEAPVIAVGPYDLPFRVFLHVIDALAWNEDVKYTTDPDRPQGKGRRNTLLTCVHIIAVFLDRVSVVDFAGAMVRGRGVAPISQKAALLHFPYLRPVGFGSAT